MKMSARESCVTAEDRLREAERLLRPATLGQCLQALGQVIELLEEIAAGNPGDWDPSVHVAFSRIRSSAQDLRLQIEHGSQLVRGWMQLRFGAGYTPKGLPEFADCESRSHFEA